MKRMIIAALSLSLLLASPLLSSAQSQSEEVVQLPAPQKEGGKPLMQALNLRKSTRGGFGPEQELSPQTLSNLLWAANGLNRKGNYHTAPSAVGWQNVEIYLTTKNGVFLYDAQKHALKVISKQDVRATAGLDGGAAAAQMKQDFVHNAPLNLVYVADLSKAKMQWAGEDVGLWWTAVGIGAIVQNVYLYCASEDLACIIRAMIDQKMVAEVLKLGPGKRVLLSQTVAQFKK